MCPSLGEGPVEDLLVLPYLSQPGTQLGRCRYAAKAEDAEKIKRTGGAVRPEVELEGWIGRWIGPETRRGRGSV